MSLGVLICVSSASRTATRAMRNAQTYPNDTSRADQCSDLISPACRVRCDSWKDTALRPSRLARLLAVLLRAELTHTPCATQSHCLTNAASAASAHATAWFATTAALAQTSHRRLRLRLHPQRRRSDHHLRRAMRCRLYSATPTHLERRFPHVLGALEAVGVPQARRETVLDFHLIFWSRWQLSLARLCCCLSRHHRRATWCQPHPVLLIHPEQRSHTVVGAPVAVVAVEQCASAPLARARPKGGDGDALPPLPPFGFGLTK